jgi:hypothetical protein
MKRYVVTFTRTVLVQADSSDEAIDRATEQVHRGNTVEEVEVDEITE